MKYCSKCGTEVFDEAVVCPKCGCLIQGADVLTSTYKSSNSGLKTAVKVFLILGCISTAIVGYLIPLCWTIPMTVSYWRRANNFLPVSTGFKICSLLFVNIIAGILMLCDSDI